MAIKEIVAYQTTKGKLFIDKCDAIKADQKEELYYYLTLNWGLCSECIDLIVNNINELIEILIELEFVDIKSEEK